MSKSRTPAGHPRADYMQVVRERVWTIVLLVALVLGFALGFSLIQPELYTADARVLVEPLPGAGGVNVETEAEIIESAIVTSLAHEGARGEIDPKKLTVRPAPQTEILIISYGGDSPEAARDTANAIANAYLESRESRYLEAIEAAQAELQRNIDAARTRLASLDKLAAPQQDPTIEAERTRLLLRLGILEQRLSELQPVLLEELGGGELIAPARTPETRTSPSLKRNLALAAALGIPLAIGVVFLQEPRLRTRRDDSPSLAASRPDTTSE